MKRHREDFVRPAVGDAIRCDGWRSSLAEILDEGDSYCDASFPGCMFRVKIKDFDMAVNVTPSGKPRFTSGCYKSRCLIEFVGDGEPSEFCRGYIFHHKSIPQNN